MREFVVDLRNVASFDDVIVAFNAGLIERCGGRWSGNLDAFNDYLSWPPEGSFRLVLRGAAQGRDRLGHAAMAGWLSAHLDTCDPSARASIRARLIAAERGEGPTLYDHLIEIISDNHHVTMVEE